MNLSVERSLLHEIPAGEGDISFFYNVWRTSRYGRGRSRSWGHAGAKLSRSEGRVEREDLWFLMASVPGYSWEKWLPAAWGHQVTSYGDHLALNLWFNPPLLVEEPDAEFVGNILFNETHHKMLRVCLLVPAHESKSKEPLHHLFEAPIAISGSSSVAHSYGGWPLCFSHCTGHGRAPTSRRNRRGVFKHTSATSHPGRRCC